MKKIIIALLLIVSAAAFSSCGKRMYATSSAGKDQVSYITIVSDARYDRVTVVVDGTEYFYGKLHKVKNQRKALPLTITPGKHRIEVKVNGQTMAAEDALVGLQETKRFVLP